MITFSISASGRDTFHEIASINSFLFVLNKKELYKILLIIFDTNNYLKIKYNNIASASRV